MPENQTYVAFLRGINIGGHHKVPMVELRKEMEHMGFEKVISLLNSGNVIFDGSAASEPKLEEEIAAHLEKIFGFPIPVLLRTAEDIHMLLDFEPFRKVNTTKNIRLYVSFLREEPEQTLNIPWVSDDKSFRIIQARDCMICSVLDISVTKTPKAMSVLEHLFGKDITTRSWNTLLRTGKKLE